MRFEEEEDRRVAKILRGLSPFCCVVERVGARMVGPREPEVDIVWLGDTYRSYYISKSYVEMCRRIFCRTDGMTIDGQSKDEADVTQTYIKRYENLLDTPKIRKPFG